LMDNRRLIRNFSSGSLRKLWGGPNSEQLSQLPLNRTVSRYFSNSERRMTRHNHTASMNVTRRTRGEFTVPETQMQNQFIRQKCNEYASSERKTRASLRVDSDIDCYPDARDIYRQYKTLMIRIKTALLDKDHTLCNAFPLLSDV
jgi:hypothetical protein